MYVCLLDFVYRRISLTAKLIGFSFTMKLVISCVKVLDYFEGGYSSILPMKFAPWSKKPKKLALFISQMLLLSQTVLNYYISYIYIWS